MYDHETISSEELRAQARRMLAEAARLEARPKDTYEVGSVLIFRKSFSNEPNPRAINGAWSYTAQKLDDRTWYVSGAKTGGMYTWHRLLDFVERDGGTVDGLWFADHLTEVVL